MIPNQSNPLIHNYTISHHQLRQALGFLGIFLPILCVVVEAMIGNANPWQPSISHYFYSKAHVLFIGALCILGALFCTYHGKWKYESFIANVAGACAFLVAIFPTGQSQFLPACVPPVQDGLVTCITCSDNIVEKNYHDWFGYIHFGSAVIMFLLIAFFCWYYFPKPEENEVDPAYFVKKKFRNHYYRISAVGIVLSLVVCYISFKENKFLPYNTVFWGETICLWLFGTSWLLKGSYSWKYSTNPILKTMYNMVR
jgi:hypothetical protein